MVRGFTLVELVAILFILSLAVKGFGSASELLLEQLRMRKIASEISSFFFIARSETMLTGEDLYIVVNPYPKEGVGWFLELKSQNKSKAIMAVEGRHTEIDLVGLSLGDGVAQLNMDGISAKYRGNGHLLIRYKNNPEKPLKLVYYSVTGRAKLCGAGGSYYGFPSC